MTNAIKNQNDKATEHSLLAAWRAKDFERLNALVPCQELVETMVNRHTVKTVQIG